MQQPIQIFIVHRFQILADVLAESLSHHPGLSIVGTATQIDKVLRLPEAQDLDVLLIEPALFDRTARKNLRKLDRPQPRAKIVPLGLVTNEQIVDHIEAGASGYVAEDASFQELIETISGVYRDQPPCSSQVAASISARMVQLAYDRGQAPALLPEGVKLTPKEAEVLELAAGGMSNKEIASQLEIAVSTVKIHIHRILGKMKVKKRREAIQLAYEAGLLTNAAASAPPQV